MTPAIQDTTPHTDSSSESPLLTAVTPSVLRSFSFREIRSALETLKARVRDAPPDSPDVWNVSIGDEVLWGVLAREEGPGGEDFLTLQFPAELR